MAATPSDNRLFPLARVVDAVQQNEKLIKVKYRPKSGILETFIEQPNQWALKSDSDYQGRLRFTTPVDCWGDSKIVLGMMREVCTNGAVVTKDIFASKVIIEKEHGTHLRQLLETFRNDRAFAAMQRRLEDATVWDFRLDEWADLLQAQPQFFKRCGNICHLLLEYPTLYENWKLQNWAEYKIVAQCCTPLPPENHTPAEWYDIIMHDHRKCVLCDCLLVLILQYPEIFAQWYKFGTGSLYQPVFWQLTKV